MHMNTLRSEEYVRAVVSKESDGSDDQQLSENLEHDQEHQQAYEETYDQGASQSQS